MSNGQINVYTSIRGKGSGRRRREREKERGKEREGKKWRAQIIDSLGNDSAMRFLSRKVSHSRKNEKN